MTRRLGLLLLCGCLAFVRVDGGVKTPSASAPLSQQEAKIDPNPQAATLLAEDWAFSTPRRPKPPRVHEEAWVINEIDAFILDRLEKAGLTHSPKAEKAALVRRLSLDLRGLPPSLQEVDSFVADEDPDAYARLVDRILASPHYGEKMAQLWLDLARYGDTSGYHFDSTRQMWLWRDWVIGAFNKNKPFDRFTIEQLAGDLLPEKTLEHKIASGFNRNTRFNEEGGADPEEFVIRYNVDRTNTLGKVWLGLTLECAECHNHKVDPISQKEYYQLFAYFTGIKEPMLHANHNQPLPPLVKVPSAEQAKTTETLQHDLLDLDKEIVRELAKVFLGLGVPAPDSFAVLEKERLELRTKLKVVEDAIAYTLITEEMSEPRPAHVLLRGDFLQKGEKVSPGVPSALPSPPAGAPKNRLGLAEWLVHPAHPLTARVVVNRLWAQLFGAGIIRTIGDFGSQGEPPSHPELLDWLATEFIASGWDVKALLKKIALSNTYQQSSRRPDDLASHSDPHNYLLSHAPRFRLSAEEIRDSALAVSGLLSRKIGGPSVMPYQPADYYKGKHEDWLWRESTGENQYRRGLYTFWRRTTLHPMFSLFDAPSRSECTVARDRTNSPVQALVTLNDPTFVEAARVYAQRILSEGPPNLPARTAYAFRLALARTPSPHEQEMVISHYQKMRKIFGADPDAASKLVNVGLSPRLANLNVTEHAAWTSVAQMLLNLDEFLTRE